MNARPVSPIIAEIARSAGVPERAIQEVGAHSGAGEPAERYRDLGDRAVTPWASVPLSCHHCKVSWGGCAAECCCPECGAPKGYHDHDHNECHCERCRPQMTAAPITMAQDMANREAVITAQHMHGHDDSEQIKGSAATPRVVHTHDRAIHHLTEAIKCLRFIETDPCSLARFSHLLDDDVKHLADEAPGSDLYTAILDIDRWCQERLDEHEYRRQNGEG